MNLVSIGGCFEKKSSVPSGFDTEVRVKYFVCSLDVFLVILSVKFLVAGLLSIEVR